MRIIIIIFNRYLSICMVENFWNLKFYIREIKMSENIHIKLLDRSRCYYYFMTPPPNPTTTTVLQDSFFVKVENRLGTQIEISIFSYC